MRCPPTMFFVLAVTSLGMAKTMKTVAPTDAVMIGLTYTFRATSITANMIVASRL